MKKFILSLIINLIIANSIFALTNYSEVYPSILQALVCTHLCHGDRHGDFKDDLVATLADGSAWKVHPRCRDLYQTWKIGDFTHVKVRTDFFWFKREHQFLLYNHTRNESVKVMLVQQKNPPTYIFSTETYYKSNSPIYDKNNNLIGHKPSEQRKILYLSDESIWVIKDHFDDFQLGMPVYIGAQGRPEAYYDFVIIVGDEREAKWTLARPWSL